MQGVPDLNSRIENMSSLSFFVIGSRGSGKTVFIQNVLDSKRVEQFNTHVYPSQALLILLCISIIFIKDASWLTGIHF